MSLQFLIGSAGSGKTTQAIDRCIRETQKAGHASCFLLVPEQYTLKTQAEVVRQHPNGGTMDIDIVSFPRLALRIFEELGTPEPILLDDMAKTLLLRKVAAEKEKDLGMFRRNIKRPGFLEELKSVLSEFWQYQIGEEELKGWYEKAGNKPLIQAKIRDILTIGSAFRAELEDNTIPEEELLSVCARHVAESSQLKGCLLVLDGFTGFTPGQCVFLRELLKAAGEVVVTLTLGSGLAMRDVTREEDLFWLSKSTYAKVGRLAEEAGVKILPDLYLAGEKSQAAPRFAAAMQLARLEKGWGRPLAEQQEKDLGSPLAEQKEKDFGKSLAEQQEKRPEEPQSVFLHQCKNPRDEVWFVAEEIGRRVRSGQYRYRDMAVVMGDTAIYGNTLKEVFKQCHIPVFYDASRSLLTNPLAMLALSILSVPEKSFAAEEVFACFKSGFFPITREACDRLENVALRDGIRGEKAFTDVWNMSEELNEAKAAALAPLLAFLEGAKAGGKTVHAYLTALRECLTGIGAEEKMAAYATGFEAKGDFSARKEYEQTWRLTMDLFDRIDALMGSEKPGSGELREILKSGFDEIRAGVIPAGLDEVTAGDLVRTRLVDVKVLFLLGMNEGILPAVPPSGGILSDLDREWLKGIGVELKPTERENSFIQKFYFYQAITKPSEELHLSFSAGDLDGAALLPSGYLSELTQALPELSVRREAERKPYEISADQTFGRVAEGLRAYALTGTEGDWEKGFTWLSSQDEYQDVIDKMLKRAFWEYQAETLGEDVAKLLYGEQLKGSVTRLEHYASCAYEWFLADALKAAERKLHVFEARDMGTLFHAALESFFRLMKKRGLTYAEVTEDVRREMTEICVSEALLNVQSTALTSTARNRYRKERLRRMTDRTIWALCEQGKRGDFLPEEVELAFSSESTRAMNLPLSDGNVLRLKGKIDRIDKLKTEDGEYIRVIDYKSGNKSFDLNEVYEGLNLQLILYLDAALELEETRHPGKRFKPAGVFYYHIDDPLVDAPEGAEEAERQALILKALSLKGLVNRDPAVLYGTDRDLTEGKRSDIFPVTIKNGIPDKRSQTASESELRDLIRHIRKKITESGDKITRGEVPVNPYKKGKDTSCTYCLFKTVCGFDPALPGFEYRRLSDLNSEEIFTTIKEENHGNGLDNAAEKSD